MVIVTVTGVSGTGGVEAVFINGWAVIDDSQSPTWTNITDSQSPNWTEIAEAA